MTNGMVAFQCLLTCGRTSEIQSALRRALIIQINLRGVKRTGVGF